MVDPYYDDGRVALHVGHVLAVLAGLEPGSVQTCITSPPYWGLRSYGTDPQVWGGDPSCPHNLVAAPGKVLTGGNGTASAKQVTNAGSQYGNLWEETHPAGYRSSDTNPGPLQSAGNTNRERFGGHVCSACGAYYGELGSEPTPEQFVANIVAVFRAVRRVLHDTGTVWCNLGDSYSGSGKGPTGHNGIGDQGQRQGFVGQGWRAGDRSASTLGGGKANQEVANRNGVPGVPGLKPKDLVGIPWRVAFALQADGWYLRSDIIWSKVNPMPESVNDRPTKAHEYIFLLAKQANYYFDAEAVREGVQRLQSNPTDNIVLSTSQSSGHRIGAMPGLFDTTDSEMADTARSGNTTPSSGCPLPPDAAGQEHETSERYIPAGEATPDRIPPDAAGAGSESTGEHLGRGAGAVGSVLCPSTDGEGGRGNADSAGLAGHQASAAEPMRLLWDAPLPGDGPCNTAESGRHAHEGERSRGVPDVQRAEGRAGRNLRSVWTIATEAYPAAHFATFPRKLVEPCILAGTSARGQCPACGAPWRRVVERVDTGRTQKMADGWATHAGGHGSFHRDGREAGQSGQAVMAPQTTGWEPSCACDAGDPVPQTILDCFAGSGTSLWVARQHFRRAIGVELNEDYAKLTVDRLKQGVLPFTEVGV